MVWPSPSLRTEMVILESQEEDVPNRILFFKPMSGLGQIRSHRRDEAWSGSLRQTSFDMTLVTQILIITEKTLVVCGYRKFQLDELGDHLCTCTTHSGTKKTHDWVVELLNFSTQQTESKHNTWLKVGVVIVGTLSWLSTLRTRGGRYLWCWTSTSSTTVSEVFLTLILMDTYITLMI